MKQINEISNCRRFKLVFSPTFRMRPVFAGTEHSETATVNFSIIYFRPTSVYDLNFNNKKKTKITHEVYFCFFFNLIIYNIHTNTLNHSQLFKKISILLFSTSCVKNKFRCRLNFLLRLSV